MKIIVTLLFILLLASCVQQPAELPERPKVVTPPAEAVDRQHRIMHDSLERVYYTYQPANFNRANPTALIFLHGGGGSAETVGERYGITAKSDAEGFLAIYPAGEGGHWNAGNCDGSTGSNCGGPAWRKSHDDVGFIAQMIDEVEKEYDIHFNNIFVAGMSNGGMMAYRLACELSPLIDGIAVVAGAQLLPSAEKSGEPIACEPLRPIPLLVIHAYNDAHVPYEGGRTHCSARGRSYPAVADAVDFWRVMNECDDSYEFLGADDYGMCHAYNSCLGAPVKVCSIPEDPEDWQRGGHSWPGATYQRNCGADAETGCPCNPTVDFSATDVMWDFFSASS